jgi:uncharacterized repeat protein (TIGR02543 family)
MIPVGTGSTVMNPMAFGSFVAGARPIPPPPQFALSLNKVGSGTILVDPPSATGNYSVGTSVTLTASPDLNYAFTGWTGDCLAAGANSSCTLVMNANKSATATFTAQYALWVTTLGNGTVTATPPANAGKYLDGTSVTLTATPNSDSVFAGWTGDCSAAGTNPSCTLMMSGTKSVTATFTATPPPPPAQFTLTVNTVGSGSVAAEPPSPAAATAASARSIAVVQPLAVVGKYSAGTQVTLTAKAAPGFKFTGWSSPCAGTGTCIVKMDADKTLTATFTTAAPPPPPPTTCDDTIKDLRKKVAGHKHPWWQNHQLKVALKMYWEAADDLARAMRKVGAKDKRYLHAKKEFDDGKAALCSGHYWRAGHDFWETVVISREILRHRR